MIRYGIYDENDRVVGEFETMEEGLEFLKSMGDGEVRPYAREGLGYYTDHYYLERGVYSRVCKGRTELRFNDDATVEPLSSSRLGIILSQFPPDEILDLLVTLDTEKARALYDGFTVTPVVWNEETRTMTVDFYYLETEDTTDADMALFYKCAPLVL